MKKLNWKFLAVVALTATFVLTAMPSTKAHADIDPSGNVQISGGVPVKIASGTVTNANNVTVDLATVSLLTRNFANGFVLKAMPTLDAGTATVQIIGLNAGGTYGNPLVPSAAVGTGVAAEVDVGAMMQDTATSGVTTRGLILSGGFKAQLIIASGVTHINSVPWELWGFP